MLIIIGIMLTALMNIKPFSLSMGSVAGIALILVSAKYAGVLAGSVAGIVLSTAAVLSDINAQGMQVYALLGLVAGIFAPLGKYFQTLALSLSALVGLCFLSEGRAEFMLEVVLGSLIFLLLPRSASISLGKVLSCTPKITANSDLNEALIMRLGTASAALSDVSKTVDNVSRELSKINSPNFSDVLSAIERDACAGCKLRLHCWESKKSETLEALLQMVNTVKSGGYSPEETTTEEFKGRCMRLNKMGAAVSRRYGEYASRVSAELRLDEVREVVSDQFEGISNMLTELADDFKADESFDNSAARIAAAALRNIGICASESTAKIDTYGRMTLEIKARRDDDIVINRLQIMKLLSLSCERDFDVPTINNIGKEMIITVHEHACLKADIGVYQEAAEGSSMCGDAYNYFNDGKGHLIMILSDGMGTGGRAAVDGAMAAGLMSRLIKAGFGFNCALKILNSSMLFKSTDESLATMDIASIDLFTGTVELYKAGAAPTLVRRSGHVGKAVSTSLPIGILREVSFDRAGIRLRHGDILLLMSDGVTLGGTEWINSELEAWRDGSAEDLAARICERARRQTVGEREDDITVIAAIIEKAI